LKTGSKFDVDVDEIDQIDQIDEMNKIDKTNEDKKWRII